MYKSSENINNKIGKKLKATYSQEDISTKQRKLQSPSPSPSPSINKKVLQVSTPLRSNSKTSTINACFTPTSLLRKVTQSPFRQSPCKTLIRNQIRKGTPEQAKQSECIEDRLVVAVRVRPLKDEEREAGVTNIIKCTDKEVQVVTNSEIIYTFQYDYVFNSSNNFAERSASQQEIYLRIANPLIERAFEGYNACLFAYGQTGSGKSYSMMGVNTFDYAICANSDNKILNVEAGIIPRFCYQIFQYIKENNVQAEVEVSFCEIYNEKIHDLLYISDNKNDAKDKRIPLKTREHPVWGPYVVGLNVHPVNTYEALQNWLVVGNSRRATVSTRHNDKSSRSHSILDIILTTNVNEKRRPGSAIRRSKISLVDLAGSERTSGSDSERLREGVCINKSLLTLGKVISSLSDGKNNISGNIFIPYRESVLTWLLRENLGGNSKTVMLATISPTNIHTEETLATLRYACQARNIVNKVKINESEQEKIIRELRLEVEKLKQLHQQTVHKMNSDVATNKTKNEIESLREQLNERELELANSQKSWAERLKDAESFRELELRLLKRKGLAFEITRGEEQAYLVNLSEDPMLSGTLFYILPLGCVKIGRTRSEWQSCQPDIMLDGPLIGYNHCIIENIRGNIYITPESKDFDTYVNGELIHDKTEIFTGDRLIFGGSHYFRVLKPDCKHRDSKKMVVDFQLAYNEVLQKQEEALRQELEQKMCIALQSIESERFENERNLKERIQQLEMERIMLTCNSEICESERKLITNSNEVSETSDLMLPTLNKVNFIEGIKNIMKGPCKSESLHKIQLMVKEATQYANDHKLKYEFKYTQLMDDFGIFQPAILIFDKGHNMMARWPLSRLEVWLDIMRNNMDSPFNTKPFNYVDIEWEPIKTNLRQTLDETLNSSSITLNCSQSNNVSLQELKDVATASSSQTNVEDFSDFITQSTIYLKEISNNVDNMQKLCQQYFNSNDRVYDINIKDSINQLQRTVDFLKSQLHAHINIEKSHTSE